MESIVFAFNRAKELIADEYACLKLTTTTYKIKLPVSYVGRVKKGISDHLKAQTNRYTPSLGGILVAYNNIHLVSNAGIVIYEGKFITFEIQADFIVFRPEIGKPLRGVVNKYGRDYVSCLVHESFNASIPRPENEAEWIGDCVDIGYEFLFNVTFVGETFLRGTIIDDSVIVPQDEENEFVSGKNVPECEENRENEFVSGENESECDEIGANEAGCDGETNGDVEMEINEEIRDETKHRKKKKRKLEEMLNGGNDSANNDETSSPRKKKKRKLDEVVNGGDGKTNECESTHRKKKKKLKVKDEDKKRDKKKSRKHKEKKHKSERKSKKHKDKVKKVKKASKKSK